MTEKKVANLQRDLEWQQAKSRLLIELTRHIGKARAIGAGELFEKVFLRPYEGNKMTGCRRLRKLIEEVKYDLVNPVFIAHSCCTVKPGYYHPSSDSERREYVAREEKKVKKKIGRLARLNRMNEAAYIGQLALQMQGPGG